MPAGRVHGCGAAVALALGAVGNRPVADGVLPAVRHLDWSPYTDTVPAGVWLMAELLLGLSMLCVVFDDSRIRTRRLRVINALTGTMARAQQHGPLMQATLEELKRRCAPKVRGFA